MKKRIKGSPFIIWIGLIIFVCSFLYIVAINYSQLEYKSEIIKYAKERGLEPAYIAAIIKTESNFQKDVISSKGAQGLMQITPDTEIWISEQLGETYKPKKMLDPESNIRYGSWYIKYLIEKYDGNKNLAILAYNAGYGNVDKWISDGKITGRFLEFQMVPFKETRNYLIKTRIRSFLYKYLYDWKS